MITSYTLLTNIRNLFKRCFCKNISCQKIQIKSTPQCISPNLYFQLYLKPNVISISFRMAHSRLKYDECFKISSSCLYFDILQKINQSPFYKTRLLYLRYCVGRKNLDLSSSDVLWLLTSDRFYIFSAYFC